jgi:hypothetical protein
MLINESPKDEREAPRFIGGEERGCDFSRLKTYLSVDSLINMRSGSRQATAPFVSYFSQFLEFHFATDKLVQDVF